MKRKAAIIGLDGLPWDITRSLIERGVTPNLKYLYEKGVRASLTSTIPPVTSPSWTSIATGVNPGKHGIFDFGIRDERGFGPATPLNIMYPRIHEIVSLKGLRSVIVNLPLSAPFLKFKGIGVGDWLAPRLFIHPKSASKLVKEYIFPYVGPFQLHISTATLLEGLVVEVKGRIKALENLLETDWDLFFVVFGETDWILHKAYDIVSSGFGKLSRPAYKVFSLIDSFIGKVLKRVGESGCIAILSDHGFSPYKNLVFINKLLLDKGLVKMRIAEQPLERSILTRGRILRIPKTLYLVVRKLTPLRAISKSLLRRVGIIPFSRWVYSIDPQNSEAYVLPSHRMGVYVKDLPPSNIIKVLKDARDPETNVPLFPYVKTRRHVYKGPYISRAPPVIYLPNMKAGYWVKINFPPLPSQGAILRGTFFEHSLYGMFLLYGNDVKTGTDLNTIKAYDVAPTILKYLDLPIPYDTDGQVLTRSFEENSEAYIKPLKYANYLERWRILKAISRRELYKLG